jgi:hypothetical protein
MQVEQIGKEGMISTVESVLAAQKYIGEALLRKDGDYLGRIRKYIAMQGLERKIRLLSEWRSKMREFL